MTKETIESANLIYKLMQDKESKVIFRNRLLYLITGERKYIHHMVEYRHRSIIRNLKIYVEVQMRLFYMEREIIVTLSLRLVKSMVV